MRYALRSLARSPGFALAVILTLALGIGANTAVFSVLRGVLLRPLPNRGGDRLVYLRQSAERAGLSNVNFSVPEIIDYRTSAKTLQGVAEFSTMTFNLVGNGEPVQVQVGIITGNYFEVMGLKTVLGRTFTAADDGAGAAPVMILTNEYWRSAFGGDSSVIGKTLRINGFSSTIVGISEPAPRFPQETDVLVNMVTSPHHLDATMVHGRSHRMTEVFARLAPSSTVKQAESELAQIGTRVRADHPADYEAAAGYQIAVTPLRDALTGRAKKTLYLLMATAALVLITACANVANLVLTRSIRRERELTVRWAMGADKGRLRRLLLSETGILAAGGAVLGVVLAFVGLDLLVGFAGRFTPRADEIRIDFGVLAFTMIVATAAALIFAFAPSLREPDSASAALIKSGSRITGAGRLQRGLIVAQVAATVIVLVGRGAAGSDAPQPGAGRQRRPDREHALDGSADRGQGAHRGPAARPLRRDAGPDVDPAGGDRGRCRLERPAPRERFHARAQGRRNPERARLTDPEGRRPHRHAGILPRRGDFAAQGSRVPVAPTATAARSWLSSTSRWRRSCSRTGTRSGSGWPGPARSSSTSDRMAELAHRGGHRQ